MPTLHRRYSFVCLFFKLWTIGVSRKLWLRCRQMFPWRTDRNAQTFFSCCVMIFEEENIVGTASPRRVTFFPVLSMYCSSKWWMHSTEKRDGVQSSRFIFVSHFLSFLLLFKGNLLDKRFQTEPFCSFQHPIDALHTYVNNLSPVPSLFNRYQTVL